MSSCPYRKSHCGDKTILPLSYIHSGISYTGNMAFLYWIRALPPIESKGLFQYTLERFKLGKKLTDITSFISQSVFDRFYASLTHWGRVMHICVSKLTIIGRDNGLLPGRCQAIIWTNAGILLIGALGTNFSEILIEIHPYFHSRKSIWKCPLENGGHFVSASMC